MPGAPRLQGRMGCGVRKRRGVQAALGTYPGARPLTTRWRGFFGTGRSKPHDMGAHLAGQPRERLLRPECVNHYTAHMPTGTIRPVHPPEKSMSKACAQGFQRRPTPPDNQITHQICPHLHATLHRAKWTRTSSKTTPKWSSCTHDSGNVLDGPQTGSKEHLNRDPNKGAQPDCRLTLTSMSSSPESETPGSPAYATLQLGQTPRGLPPFVS